MEKEIADLVDKMDAEIMNDFYYPTVEMSFDVEMIAQDSTDLRAILEDNIRAILTKYRNK